MSQPGHQVGGWAVARAPPTVVLRRVAHTGENKLTAYPIDIRLDDPMPGRTASTPEPNGAPVVQAHYCVPDDQQRYLPRQSRIPTRLHPNVPMPRVGDVVYLSPRSAWGVQLVVYDWRSPGLLCIEVWLQHVATTAQRPTGFAITQ